MNHLDKIKAILGDLLDIDEDEILPETYLIRELDAESIDLLEIAVTMNSEFGVEINDDEIFMKNLRVHLGEAQEAGIENVSFLAEKYPFLSAPRIEELLADIPGGPVLKIKDLAAYVEWRMKG